MTQATKITDPRVSPTIAAIAESPRHVENKTHVLFSSVQTIVTKVENQTHTPSYLVPFFMNKFRDHH